MIFAKTKFRTNYKLCGGGLITTKYAIRITFKLSYIDFAAPLDVFLEFCERKTFSKFYQSLFKNNFCCRKSTKNVYLAVVSCKVYKETGNNNNRQQEKSRTYHGKFSILISLDE